jgi:tetratricopeptide (TPR) repeat protein
MLTLLFGLALAMEVHTAVIDPVRGLHAEAWRLALKGDYAAAERCWSGAIRLLPTEGQFYAKRAMARGMLGDVAGADADVRASFRYDSPWAAALRTRVVEACDAEDYEVAHELLAELLRDNPDDYQAYRLRAGVRFAQGRVGECLADLKQSLLLRPTYNPAIAVYGLLLNETDKAAAARASYLADRWMPDDANAVRLRAHVAYRGENWERAAQAFEQVMQGGGEMSDEEVKHFGVAVLHHAGVCDAKWNLVGTISETLPRLRRMGAYYALGKAYSEDPGTAQTANLVKAVAFFDTAWELGKQDVNLLASRACACYHAKDFAAAALDYRRAIVLRPRNVRLRKFLILTLSAAERYDDASEEVRWLKRMDLTATDRQDVDKWLQEIQPRLSPRRSDEAVAVHQSNEITVPRQGKSPR